MWRMPPTPCLPVPPISRRKSSGSSRNIRLNRVMVASCTPRTHEPLFRNTLREAGLNPYLFELANIREQDSWVHQAEPEAATNKAKDLVRMSVSRAQPAGAALRLLLRSGAARPGDRRRPGRSDRGPGHCRAGISGDPGGAQRRAGRQCQDALSTPKKAPAPPSMFRISSSKVEANPLITVYKDAEVVSTSGKLRQFHHYRLGQRQATRSLSTAW